MEPILFSTDFSPVAQNAANYALQLAQFLKVDLVLFHTYFIPINPVENAATFMSPMALREAGLVGLDEEKKRLESLNLQVKIHAKLEEGDTIDCLNLEIKSNPTLMLVMGTAGLKSPTFLWGSTAIRAIRAFPIPVLTVPSGAKWKSPEARRLTLAADYRTMKESGVLQKVIFWTQKLQATLKVAHIELKPEERVTPPDWLVTKLKDMAVSYHSVDSRSILDGVHDFLDHNPTDWLILLPQRYSFWKGLFHRSISKMLAQVSTIPILALHED